MSVSLSVAWNGSKVRATQHLFNADGTQAASFDVLVLGDDAMVVAQPAAYAARTLRTEVPSFVGGPGGFYFQHLGWSPLYAADVRDWVFSDGAQVRSSTEDVLGSPCFVVDVARPDGSVAVTVWLDPAHNWWPARQVLWGADGTERSRHEVTAWHAIAPGRFLPASATISYGGTNQVGVLEVRRDSAGALRMGALIPDGLLPSSLEAIVPAGMTPVTVGAE